MNRVHVEVAIAGGGVIGLSLAYELARRGLQVGVLERIALGRAASWAAAGILPPPATARQGDPLEQLRARAHLLHLRWSRELLEETGIDNQWCASGGIYLGLRAGEVSLMRAWMDELAEGGIRAEVLDRAQLVELEPALGPLAPRVALALRLPDECRIRPSRHLDALIAACRRRGVQMLVPARGLQCVARGGKVEEFTFANQTVTADQFVLAAGAWVGALLAPLGLHVPIEPRRGQIAMWQLERAPLRHVINEGLRYLVPRDDGVVLAGATVEESGFDARPTGDAAAELRAFASNLLAELDRPPDVVWAGLRPWTPDGMPYLGRLPGLDNAWIAAGHYRSGIHLAPATAELLADAIQGKLSGTELQPFRLDR